LKRGKKKSPSFPLNPNKGGKSQLIWNTLGGKRGENECRAPPSHRLGKEGKGKTVLSVVSAGKKKGLHEGCRLYILRLEGEGGKGRASLIPWAMNQIKEGVHGLGQSPSKIHPRVPGRGQEGEVLSPPQKLLPMLERKEDQGRKSSSNVERERREQGRRLDPLAEEKRRKAIRPVLTLERMKLF